MGSPIEAKISYQDIKIDLSIAGIEPNATKSLLEEMFGLFTKEVTKIKSIEEGFKSVYANYTEGAQDDEFDAEKEQIAVNIESTIVEPVTDAVDVRVEIEAVVDEYSEKYNKEFHRLNNPIAKSLYTEIMEKRINVNSYFVTEKGDLKLQARYSCKCGDFAKVFVKYPSNKKHVRCNKCHRENILVHAYGNFPCIDEYGNFLVSTNIAKQKE